MKHNHTIPLLCLKSQTGSVQSLAPSPSPSHKENLSTCLGMNTEWTLEQVIQTLCHIHVKTRKAILKHYLIFGFCFLWKDWNIISNITNELLTPFSHCTVIWWEETNGVNSPILLKGARSDLLRYCLLRLAINH